jgi:predicted alpha/beta hydrolase family esterase
MKNFVTIHGCPSDVEKALNPETRTYDKHWQPWLVENLKKHGYVADFPLMPEPWSPVYEEYKKVVDNLEINENTTLIGHSCGSAFLVRYLGDTKKKIDKLILVAPWKIPDEDGSE